MIFLLLEERRGEKTQNGTSTHTRMREWENFARFEIQSNKMVSILIKLKLGKKIHWRLCVLGEDKEMTSSWFFYYISFTLSFKVFG